MECEKLKNVNNQSSHATRGAQVIDTMQIVLNVGWQNLQVNCRDAARWELLLKRFRILLTTF
jgi:hypothetical protein